MHPFPRRRDLHNEAQMSPSPQEHQIEDLLAHAGWVRELARQLTRNTSDADDLVQNTWVAALRSPPTSSENLRGWLARVVQNFAYRTRRGEARRSHREEQTARPEAQPSAEALLDRVQARRGVVEAVLELQEPYKSTVLLRYFEGLPPRAIASCLGVPVNTVRSRLARALDMLRARLNRTHGIEGGWALALSPLMIEPNWKAHLGLGVVLMNTKAKIACAVTVVAITGTVLLRSIGDAPITPPPGSVSMGGSSALERPPNGSESVPPALATVLQHSPEPQVRTAVAPVEPEVGARVTIQVSIRNAATGATEPGATVWFVKPGFDYAQLPPEQQEQYSRSPATFLLAQGMAQVTDASGSTRIPIAAAYKSVVARKGNLYGSGWLRSDDVILEIRVAVHPILVVETVDALGAPVPHVNVVSTSVNAFHVRVAFGTTDGEGRITRVLDPPGADPREVWLFAELLGGDRGPEIVDLNAPPPYPVRFTIPATGTVRARIVDANGGTLDRGILDGLYAELRVNPEVATAKRHYVAVDAEGNATFANVVLGKAVGLRFPPLLDTVMVHAGPSEAEPTVTFVHSIVPDHPYLLGILVDPNDQPVGNASFAIFCRSPSSELLAAAGGKTDAFGRFTAYLSARCTGQGPVELTLAMDPTGMGFAREVRVPLRTPLFGRVDLGKVVMPTKK